MTRFPSVLAVLTLISAISSLPPSAKALERVAVELVLAVDVSSSVSDEEFSLQMRGIAAGFRDQKVVDAIERTEGGIAVAVLQWSGMGRQRLTGGWFKLVSAADAYGYAALVETFPREIGGGATAIGAAIHEAMQSLDANGYFGARQVIDVSGDGIANEGTSPPFIVRQAVDRGITVNGLAVANEEPNLASYYRVGVIGGPGAFVIGITDYTDFASAMRRKLLAEIEGNPVSALPFPDADDHG
ncbi:MAG: DUF1194 domain-containing protein [Alphaproteobacteria bacterium]|nr:DUF1194 domain-containing protein [Alphaproteobacteria bacterium]